MMAALGRARSQVPSGVDVYVTIVLDACSDRSESASRRALRSLSGEVCCVDGRNVGKARAAGVERTLRRFGHRPADQVWLATTDADSCVPPNWLVEQLRLTEKRDAHAIAGTVAVKEWGSYPTERAQAYERFYASGGEEHPHIHGANLGVRADMYRAVGGFQPLTTGEDVAIWAELAKLPNARLVKTRSIPVVTSSRLRGRAPRGFAAFLGNMLHSS